MHNIQKIKSTYPSEKYHWHVNVKLNSLLFLGLKRS